MKKRIASKSKKSKSRNAADGKSSSGRSAVAFKKPVAAHKASIANSDAAQIAVLPRRGRRRISELTDRETQVLKLIAEGRTSREAARKLKISDKTVDAHKANIVRKLKTRGIAAIVKYALRTGLISIED
jgi:DNA-binding CsgD family transcriptional regulator